MIRFAALGLLIGQLCFCSVVFAEDEGDYKFDISYSYGTIQLLPSLISNSGFDFDWDKNYSDIWINADFKITDKLSYAGSLELTNQPHEFINTKFSRPDYPLTTARFQRSIFSYSTKDFVARVGRDDMLGSHLRPDLFNYPTSGDGFSWKYSRAGWSAKHVFQVLPAERGNGQLFRRSISYHHLTKDFQNFTLGVGEYFILSGEQIGFDLKRLNPFLPYALNSHDSEADYFSGYVGDSDNSLIKLFLNWRKKSSEISFNLYVDEFQIDGDDRELFNDAMLLSVLARSEVDLMGARSEIKWGLAASNPNFGQHPGPFTTPTIGLFPIFEFTPGMKTLAYFESKTSIGNEWHFSVAGHAERWVNISQLNASQMNNRAALEALKINFDSRLMLGVEYGLKNYPINIVVAGWLGSDSGISLRTQFSSGRKIKQ